ncbi:MAG TPA: hypothetical protein GX745_08325 [Clostridiales bacterium]|nr:hypothetical protein [Clostridiales bacterium]
MGIDLYFAGYDGRRSDIFLFEKRYNQLFSWINDRKRAENHINWREGMDLYLAGTTPSPQVGIDTVLWEERYPRLLSFYWDKRDMDKYIANKILQLKGGPGLELYLVGPEKADILEEVFKLEANMLFNYIDGKNATDAYKTNIKPGKLFIDSGAYSAWTRGAEIDVDEYIAWINERADYIDLFGQVDVIPGDRIHGATMQQVIEAAEKTWENYLYMRERVKCPERLLYTFHVGEPLQYLERALEWKDAEGQKIPYIALGGMVGKPRAVRQSFLDQCFSTIRKSSNSSVKVHTFGMTDFSLLASYPITSADSTSWIMTGANGGIMTDMGTVIVSERQSNQPNHYSHLPKHLQKDFEETIAEYGFTLDELRHSRDKRIIFNARYMHKKASELVYNPGPKKLSLF